MNKIEVIQIEKVGTKICVHFKVDGDVKRYFQTDIFVSEYINDISAVPDSIAVIPFVCNVLPIIWLTDSFLNLPVLDQSFYNGLEQIKEGYCKMYPNMLFRGILEVGNIVDNKINIERSKRNCTVLFSGGIDAFSTLLNHINERPILLTIWGADIKLNDTQGWNNVYGHTRKVAQSLGLEYGYVKANFREFIAVDRLSVLVKESGDEWWHGFQHGIGLIGLVAPIAYLKKLYCVYIASSYAVNNVTCASHPTIDNYVAFAGCNTIHDQYMYTRQQKVGDICAYARRVGQYPLLRVCWESSGGKNCGYCEKCLRSVYGLIVEGEEPNNYGFHIKPDKIRLSINKIIQTYKFPIHNRCYWKEIQQRYRGNKENILPSYRQACLWLDEFDFEVFHSKKYKLKYFFFKLKSVLSHWDTLSYVIKTRLRIT